MAVNNKGLTRQWIEFLKNNQIVSTKSDPNTGKLNYKRQVTSSDLVRFIESKTNLTEDDIYDAIHSVLEKNNKIPDKLQVSVNQDTASSDDQDRNTASDIPGISHRKKFKKYPSDDIEDVEYTDIPRQNTPISLSAPRRKSHGGKQSGVVSQTPNAIRKRNARMAKRSLTEDFVDQPVELSEKDVEDIFSIIQTKISSISQHSDETHTSPEQIYDAKLDKLKNLIRSTMTANQRQALWQLLNEDDLREEKIAQTSASQIFKNAAKSKTYNNLKNEKIDINDLQQAWKNTGFSLDTDIIGKILHDFGYSDNEINDVFDQTLGDAGESKDTSSPAIIKIVEYIKNNDLQDEIIQYMKQNFSDELDNSEIPKQEPDKGFFGNAASWFNNKFGRKATIEDVRHIFTAVILKERSMRHTRIKECENIIFGRNKK